MKQEHEGFDLSSLRDLLRWLYPLAFLVGAAIGDVSANHRRGAPGFPGWMM
jgi:hypothetical protein